MNELIKVTNNDGRQAVSARDLYLGLGLDKSQWSRWYKTNIMKNDFFEEYTDWIGVRHLVEGNETMDFAISLEFGKHIAMMARTEKSHQYRNYFIKIEEEIKNQIDTSQLSPELQMFNQVFKTLANQEVKTKQLESKVDGISDLVQIDTDDWRQEAVSIIRRIAISQGGFDRMPELFNESYERLEDRGRCNLNIRLNNKEKNMLSQGMNKTAIKKLNKLDIIQEDHRLIQIYMSVVKDMAIKYRTWEE